MAVEANNVVISTSNVYEVTPVEPVHVASSKSFSEVDGTPKNVRDSPTDESESSKSNCKEASPVKSPGTASSANTNVGKYRLLRTIGKGNFAKVKLAIHMATNTEVAIKIINKTVMDSTLLKRLKREITIMKITNHPNIVKLLEIIENEDVLCLVMEYASGGEIFDYLVSNGKMREKEARNKFRQLLSAIQYCHSKRIVHRDLKAENILLDKNLNVKVADFGLANSFELGQRLKTFCGSPPYAAPELFLGVPYFGPSVDVWSLGVILFTLVLGHLPFDARDLRELRSKILSLNYTIPRGSVSTECEALLRKMLILDPKDRSSLKVLMQDKWINIGYAPNEFLRPYKEPPRSHLDELRVKAMEAMGFTKAELESSVVNPEFDHVYATYNLLPETPSQFATLYDESSTRQSHSHSVALPNSLVPCQPRVNEPVKHVERDIKQNCTAIGRFTVAPSSKNGEHNSQSATTTANTTSKASVLVSEPTREHHSLTSTLPVALRRAFHQMGRTFGGVTGSPVSGTTTSGNAESHVRTHIGGYTRSTKPATRTNGARNVITAAPVPMGAVKKTGFGVSQPAKRPSPIQQSPAINLDSTHTGRSNVQQQPHTSHAATRPSSNLNPPYQLKSDLANHKPYNNSPKQLKQDSECRSLKSPNSQPVTGPSTPVVNIPPMNPPTISNQIVQSQNESTKPFDGPINPTSYEDQEARETAAILVQHVWRSVDPFTNDQCNQDSTSAHLCEYDKKSSKQPNDQLDNLRKSSKAGENGYSDTETISSRNEKSEISRSLTNIGDRSTNKLNTTNWSPADDDKQSGKLSLSPTQAKVSHTVQGSEALALRDQALRLQSSTQPTNSPISQSPNCYTLDSGHHTMWSRGVFKALGGFFVQNKPIDSNHLRTINKPREVRFPWSVHTTSTKSAEDLLQSIIEALDSIPGCRYTHDPHLPFLLQCSWAANRDTAKTVPGSSPSSRASSNTTTIVPQFEDLRPSSLLRGDPVHWEMEVCQLPRVHLRGVRLKRIRGSTLHFRPIAGLVMKALKL